MHTKWLCRMVRRVKAAVSQGKAKSHVGWLDPALNDKPPSGSQVAVLGLRKPLSSAGQVSPSSRCFSRLKAIFLLVINTVEQWSARYHGDLPCFQQIYHSCRSHNAP